MKSPDFGFLQESEARTFCRKSDSLKWSFKLRKINYKSLFADLDKMSKKRMKIG